MWCTAWAPEKPLFYLWCVVYRFGVCESIVSPVVCGKQPWHLDLYCFTNGLWCTTFGTCTVSPMACGVQHLGFHCFTNRVWCTAYGIQCCTNGLWCTAFEMSLLHQWFSMVTNLWCTALATENPTPELLLEKPHGRSEPLISRIMWRHVVVQGCYQLCWLFLIIYGASAHIPAYK